MDFHGTARRIPTGVEVIPMPPVRHGSLNPFRMGIEAHVRFLPSGLWRWCRKALGSERIAFAEIRTAELGSDGEHVSRTEIFITRRSGGGRKILLQGDATEVERLPVGMTE